MSDDPSHPWAVRNMDKASRLMAAEAARRAGMPLAEWLRRAIRAYVAAEREEDALEGEVMPPGQIVMLESPGTLSIAELGRAIEIAARIAELRGKAVPRAVTARASRILHARLAEGASRPRSEA